MKGLLNVELTVNGKTLEATDRATITALLEQLQINPLRVAVQLNQRIIKRELYERTVLQAGDTLEVLTFMAGGSQ
ncbi:sulfur carrier protein ThiS [Candidatus Methylomirabilis sp.]|uniref:sulfur carrier protein ThiS n=1 Tax=Candidatus Methylomirabilis sp. TaxID=2032687 RepID=UPI003076335A